MLDDLDLFAFSEVMLEGRKTNALIEALARGFDTIIDYAFNDGYINVRSILKKNNLFEIENDIAHFNVSYFKNHF